MSQITAKYEDGLKEDLINPDETAAYLEAALAENDQTIFMLALRDVAEVHKSLLDAPKLLFQALSEQQEFDQGARGR